MMTICMAVNCHIAIWQVAPCATKGQCRFDYISSYAPQVPTETMQLSEFIDNLIRTKCMTFSLLFNQNTWLPSDRWCHLLTEVNGCLPVWLYIWNCWHILYFFNYNHDCHLSHCYLPMFQIHIMPCNGKAWPPPGRWCHLPSEVSRHLADSVHSAIVSIVP